ncbi:MAG: sigma-70 family RNA polymerase sigma factor [Propionicimonas sp.]|uniref:sigma-70 family RNA polymerase sigma factor n=1 Tax=Propionicimonas sp. TaxID=1955623 RepID=UPI002B208BE4|nr:sigma-70 family RNA polymerase sigma factor [Propionicimonas sp.]MEA4945279.1 sigma-70 family RNA polymerase sigma factor [Propionicimonas sp.]
MARGVALAAVPQQREQRTAELFTELHGNPDPGYAEQLVDELVRVNLPLCDSLAGRYVGRGTEHDDLLQVARAALVVAIHRFEPRLGRPFASFAVPTIAGELKRHFRDHGWMVRPPRQLQELRARATRGRQALEQAVGHEVSIDDLGRHLEVDPQRLRESLAAGGGYRPVSLEAPARDDASVTVGDALSDQGDAIEELIEHLDLRRALTELSHRDQAVLRWRFAEECSQSEIGRRLGVSQMQVSRILRALLAQLRIRLQPPQQVAA